MTSGKDCQVEVCPNSIRFARKPASVTIIGLAKVLFRTLSQTAVDASAESTWEMRGSSYLL